MMQFFSNSGVIEIVDETGSKANENSVDYETVVKHWYPFNINDCNCLYTATTLTIRGNIEYADDVMNKLITRFVREDTSLKQFEILPSPQVEMCCKDDENFVALFYLILPNGLYADNGNILLPNVIRSVKVYYEKNTPGDHLNRIYVAVDNGNEPVNPTALDYSSNIIYGIGIRTGIQALFDTKEIEFGVVTSNPKTSRGTITTVQEQSTS